MRGRIVCLTCVCFLFPVLLLHAQGTATFGSRPQAQPMVPRGYSGIHAQAPLSQAPFSSRLYPNLPGQNLWRGFGSPYGWYPYWPFGRVPVFGLGFDAHHYTILNRWQRLGFGNNFYNNPFNNFYNNPYNNFYNQPWGWFPIVSSSAVVVPQVIPMPVPLTPPVAIEEPRPVEEEVPLAERLVGTPRADERIEVVQPRLAAEPLPAPRLTLLVFKDHSIYAVSDYWLEGGQLHYVTSYGARNAVPIEQVDLEMTARLNWERNVEFTLRPARSTH